MNFNAIGRIKPDSNSQGSHFYVAHGLIFKPRDLSFLDRAGSHFYVAEYSAYLEQIAKGVTQCPECGSFNKKNRYKAQK